jgi:RsmE family RNA methyltransferase
MKRILREAVSLGVEQILITGADTAERSYASAKLWSTGEFRAYLLNGAMQSGQTSVPSCSLFPSLDALLDSPHPWKSRILLDNVLDGGPLSQAQGIESPVVLAIGPERGWSERERSLFLKHGFMPHSLGERVLRTETACSAATAILLGRLGYI